MQPGKKVSFKPFCVRRKFPYFSISDKIFIFLALVVIIVALVGYKFISYKNEQNQIQKENLEFDKYKDQDVNGIDVASLINKAIDRNTKNKVEKDDQGNFIANDNTSIEIEVYMTDNETTYKMESFYNAGTEQFVQYYANINFKCSKVEYHKNGKIKYMLFEQEKNS